jgi:hypothetical protein
MNKEQEVKLKKAIIKMLPPAYIYARCDNCDYESSFQRTVHTFNWELPVCCPFCGSVWTVRAISDGNYDG